MPFGCFFVYFSCQMYARFYVKAPLIVWRRYDDNCKTTTIRLLWALNITIYNNVNILPIPSATPSSREFGRNVSCYVLYIHVPVICTRITCPEGVITNMVHLKLFKTCTVCIHWLHGNSLMMGYACICVCTCTSAYVNAHRRASREVS